MSNQFGSYNEAINILKVCLQKNRDVFSGIAIQRCIDAIQEAWNHEERLFCEHMNKQAQMEALSISKEDFEEVH